jgi:hypothetical protein
MLCGKRWIVCTVLDQVFDFERCTAHSTPCGPIVSDFGGLWSALVDVMAVSVHSDEEW